MSKTIKNIVKKDSQILFWQFRFLPKGKREAIYTLYAFFRHIDFILEGDMEHNKKIDFLKSWIMEFDNIYDKKVPETEIGRKIYKNCMRFKLPKHEFIRYLNAFLNDLLKPINALKFTSFINYCRDTIGASFNLILRVLECDDKILEEFSLEIGKAIRTVIILKELKDDANKGHLYIPIEFLEKAKIKNISPLQVITDKNIVFAREELAEVARNSFENLHILLDKLDGTALKQIRAAVNHYKKYFDIMDKRGWEIISPKPRIGKRINFSLIVKNFLGIKLTTPPITSEK